MNVIVDPEDVDLLGHSWRCSRTGDTVNRQITVDGRRVNLAMSRVVLERKLGRPLTRSEIAMHINRNPLDNRRSNLCVGGRHCVIKHRSKQRTHAGKTTTSKYRGVSWIARNRKWRADITLTSCQKYLGSFSNEEDAAHVYDKAARDFFGRCAYQNFPEEARP